MLEIERIKGVLNASLGGLDDAGKVAKLAGRVGESSRFTSGILMNLAETYEQREAIRSLAMTPAGDIEKMKAAADQLVEMLNKRIAILQSKPNPRSADQYVSKITAAVEKSKANPRDADARQELIQIMSEDVQVSTRDENDRKRQIAHFLMNLDSSAAWQKRVALIVGIRQLQYTVSDQATRMRDMARSAQRQLESDQASFLEQYKQLETLATERSQLLIQQTEIRKAIQSRAESDSSVTARRKRQLEDRVTELDTLIADVTKRLEEQAAVEGTIFNVQKEAALMLERLFDLENKLIEAEKAKR